MVWVATTAKRASGVEKCMILLDRQQSCNGESGVEKLR